MTYPAPVATRDAAICVVEDRNGRVLTVARIEPPHEQAIPGGHIDGQETAEQAVRRELREECGVMLGYCWQVTEPNADGLWRPIVLEHDGHKCYVFKCCEIRGLPVDAEGPLDGPVVDVPAAVKWLTPPELIAQSSLYRADMERLAKAGTVFSSQWMASDQQAAAGHPNSELAPMDLGVQDVHRPGPMNRRPKNVAAGDLPTPARNALPKTEFGWPEQRKFPLPDAAHVRNAAARLAQAVKAGHISKGTAAKIHKRIVAAGKRFGVEVASTDDGLPAAPHVAPVAHPGPMRSRRGPATRLDVTIDHPQHGRFEIRHMKDVEIRLPSIPLRLD